ncbi:hypothetical protein QCA50_016678 [Cerrena zonata]|uniref:Uncharacterized protein n=1 Tax=Cerrena zonata TaxID=2478898 RepID=A0AAW0FPN1_9APHY
MKPKIWATIQCEKNGACRKGKQPQKVSWRVEKLMNEQPHWKSDGDEADEEDEENMPPCHRRRSKTDRRDQSPQIPQEPNGPRQRASWQRNDKNLTPTELSKTPKGNIILDDLHPDLH